jgi:polyphosphate kinase 2
MAKDKAKKVAVGNGSALAKVKEKSKGGKGKGGKSKGKKSTAGKVSNSVYEAELLRLQAELVKVQEWVRATGARIVIIFEGRDAAGKGGTIKRITEYLSPRTARIAALPAPSDREKGQWYFQRYIEHLPTKGEIVLFDRSWYNRAGVERVMGFATPEEETLFLRQTPIFEQMLIDDGIMLRKYWFSVSEDEQLRRFKSRLDDPLRRWKLSPMDMESVYRWEDYSRAKDDMMIHCDTSISPWFEVESHIKKHARLNMISHLLSTIPYTEVEMERVIIPERPQIGNYRRPPRDVSNFVPDFASTLLGDKEG